MIDKKLAIGLIITGIVVLGITGGAVYFGLFDVAEKETIIVDSAEHNVTSCAALNGLCTSGKTGYFSACSGGVPDCSCSFVDCGSNYCSNGKCVGKPAGACTDSDGGLNYTVRGVCGGLTDECKNSTTLKEAYCENNVCVYQEYDCATDNKVCSEGECIAKAETYTCASSSYPACGGTCPDGATCKGDPLMKICACAKDKVSCSDVVDPENQADCNFGSCEKAGDACWFMTDKCACDVDSDGDGLPNEVDLDDDNDGWSDDDELAEGTDPLDPDDYPDYKDSDGDGILDIDDFYPDVVDWSTECTGAPPGDDGEDCWMGVCSDDPQGYKCIYGGIDLGCTCVLRSSL